MPSALRRLLLATCVGGAAALRLGAPPSMQFGYGIPRWARERGIETVGTRNEMKPYAPYSFVSTVSTYTVSDWGTASRLVNEHADCARADASTMFCGWSRCGDRLSCRIAFADADTARAHLARTAAPLEALGSGPATRDAIEVYGPAAELRKLREGGALGEACCLDVASGVSFMVKECGATLRGLSHVTLQPTFAVRDAGAALAIAEEAVALVDRLEGSGCAYYGWCVSAAGKSASRGAEPEAASLVCRMAHNNADAVGAHLANAGALIEALLDGPATLRRVELHGPAAAVEACRPKVAASALGAATGVACEEFEQVRGFQTYELSWAPGYF